MSGTLWSLVAVWCSEEIDLLSQFKSGTTRIDSKAIQNEIRKSVVYKETCGGGTVHACAFVKRTMYGVAQNSV